MSVAIVIPARFSSTRLPGKSLADINGLPMVVRVMNIAKRIGKYDVIVATEDKRVVDAVEKYNGVAVLTDNTLQSGTDRVYQAINKIGKDYDYIINLQGDMPNVKEYVINNVIDILQNNKIDIATAIYKIQDNTWREKKQVVKAVISYNETLNFHKCLYFSRSNVPYGEGDCYAHLGIYGYTRKKKKKFVSLKQSLLEKSEKLEQLRALENGMSIYATIVKDFPISVDIQEDLDLARKTIRSKIVLL